MAGPAQGRPASEWVDAETITSDCRSLFTVKPALISTSLPGHTFAADLQRTISIQRTSPRCWVQQTECRVDSVETTGGIPIEITSAPTSGFPGIQ